MALKSLPRAVVVLGVVSFLTDASSEMIMPLLPMLLLGPLGGSTVALGLVDGIADALSAILKLVAGRLSDKYPRKKPFVLVGYGLSSAVRPLIGLAMTPWHIVVVRAVDRMGKGVRSAPRDAILANSVTVDNSARAFGFHRAMDHAGAVVGPLLATAVLALGADVRLAIQLAWIPGIAAVLVLLLFLREGPPPTTTTTAPTPTQPSIANPAAGWTPLPPSLVQLLVMVGLFGLIAVADMFLLVRARELGLAEALLPVVWVVLHLAKVIAASRGSQIKVQAVTAVAVAWMVVGGGFALATVDALPVFFGAVIVIGLGHGGREPFEKAIVRQLAPSAILGRCFGAYHLTAGIVALPSGLAIGYLWSGDGVGGGLTLAIAGAGAVLTGGALLLMRRTWLLSSSSSV